DRHIEDIDTEMSEHLVREGLEPVFQLTCRDRNRLAVQTELLSAAWVGIENVLALTGDHQYLGDHPDAKGVFDLDSVSLLQTIAMLAEGKDLAGNELAGTPKFFPGACVSPGLDPVEPQLLKMEKKIEAGAKFFQTQAVYDAGQMETFMKQAEKFGVPVLAGIVVLKSAGMARFMNKFVAGVFVPKHLIKEMGKYKKKADQKKKGAEIAGQLIAEMKDMCQGAHLMPLGWTDTIDDIMAHAGLA
ncbi:MAG: methylenetetrahydrofolate reductase, partial [Planctomycetota bacterium]